jgi:hypothetical protein
MDLADDDETTTTYCIDPADAIPEKKAHLAPRSSLDPGEELEVDLSMCMGGHTLPRRDTRYRE